MSIEIDRQFIARIERSAARNTIPVAELFNGYIMRTGNIVETIPFFDRVDDFLPLLISLGGKRI